MILNRQHFDIDNRCIIEKVIVRTPMRYSRIFPNEACFLHFKSGQLNIASATDKTEIKASQSVLLNCGNHFADLVQNSSGGTMEMVAIHLFPDLLKEIYHTENLPSLKPSYIKIDSKRIENTSFITQFVSGLNIYFENPALVTTELLILKLRELILLLLQTDKASTIADLFAQLFTPREVKLKDIVQAHLFSDMTIAELATLAGQSLSSFKRDFQRNYNDSPANYIRLKRLNKAQKLLGIPTLSVSEICYQVGFNDLSHFSKVFKKHIGTSPAEYRHRISLYKMN
jgi:AraC-like DNA-binding protein